MKQFFLLLVLAAIVVFTSLARAQDQVHGVPVKFQIIDFDEETLSVAVRTVMPNICTDSPRPMLTLGDGHLVLNIVARQEGRFCVFLPGPKVPLEFSLISLRHQLDDLNLDSAGVYQIISADGSLIAEVDFGAYAFIQPMPEPAIKKMLPVNNESEMVVVNEQNIFTRGSDLSY